jgi:hypothetical protein
MKLRLLLPIYTACCAICFFNNVHASNKIPHVTYYFHPIYGNDNNQGNSWQSPFRTLAAIEKIKLHPGDKIILAAGQTFYGSLKIIGQSGDAAHPITIQSAPTKEGTEIIPATINFQEAENGILLEDANYFEVSGIRFTANGNTITPGTTTMRCAVMVRNLHLPVMQHVHLNALDISEVFYERPGYIRPAGEVRSPNGTQKYGWGIRIMNPAKQDSLIDIEITNCRISCLSHTGIKFTGAGQNIRDVKLLYNTVTNTGGPGIQLSGVRFAYAAFNKVDHSGSIADGRNWARGSGLWTWGCSDILIEHNTFQFANGPGDSDGAHIDYNCSNIILQYNLSVGNAGGFCEILGNTYNCIYRFNVSINDGFRTKGVNGAFQEGKTLWLSGYQGDHQKRKGPVNTFIYNNTIYTDSTIFPKLAFDNTSQGIFIFNNLFATANPFQLVLGDQYKPDIPGRKNIETMFVRHNLFLKQGDWPADLENNDMQSLYADPGFMKPGGMRAEDYTPKNIIVLQGNRIMQEKDMPGNPTASNLPIQQVDILGNQIDNLNLIGAITPVKP